MQEDSVKKSLPINKAMEKSHNAFAVAKFMGHVDLKSIDPTNTKELEPLREAINQCNQRKKFGQVLKMNQ